MARSKEIDTEWEERFWRGYLKFRRRRTPWLMLLWVLPTVGLGIAVLAILGQLGVDAPGWLVVVPVGLYWIPVSVYMYRYTACPRCHERSTIIYQRFFPETCPYCGCPLESEYRRRIADREQP